MITAGADPSVLMFAGAVVELVPAGPATRIPPATFPPTISALPAAGLVLVVDGVSVPAAASVSLICRDPPTSPVTIMPSAPAPTEVMLPSLPSSTLPVTSPATSTAMIGGDEAVNDAAFEALMATVPSIVRLPASVEPAAMDRPVEESP